MTAGYILGGKYELVRLLGRGSMGEVWIARHTTLGEQVAVKLLTRDPGQDGPDDGVRAAARFRFEAQVAARLSRKTRHIVRVTDHGDHDGGAYLVMELLEGKTLAERLLLRGTLPPREVGRLVVQAARALVIAHADGIVHRDLKPANIFFTRDEDGRVLVKLLDFGIARTIHRHRIPLPFETGAGFAAGTPGYMSPEQARGSNPDARFDLWALATVAYEALTEELPVPGSSTQELFENACAGRILSLQASEAKLVGGLTAFFERAFAPRAEDRYANASELAAAFERAIGEPTGGSRERSSEAPQLRSREPTLRMPASPRPAPAPAPRSAGTQRTVTLAMVSPVTRRRGTIGSGIVIAGTLLLGAATAVLGYARREPSSPVAVGASPATNTTTPGAALVSDPPSAGEPPVVVLSPPPSPEEAPALVKPPHAGPRLPVATIASAAMAPAARPPATTPVEDKSATF
jgi:serine/threonine protein kinase